MKKKTTIQRILEAGCKQKGLDPNKFKILDSEGNRLLNAKQLANYDVQDGDTLDVVIDQQGGSDLLKNNKICN